MIGYRRLSGPIGLTDQETGTRGMWLEKRRALWAWLRQAGHELIVFGRLTAQSQGRVLAVDGYIPCDILMLEFGGTNLQFFGKDIEQTKAILRVHAGPVVFLCDDPDLWAPADVLEIGPERWRIWANASKAEGPELPTRDVPFGALLPIREPDDVWQIPRLAYIGRLEGRRSQVGQADARALAIYGRAKEWPGYALAGQPPEQAYRADLYRAHVGVLGLADAKHRRTGWRTGRVSHAISAGVPVTVAADHQELRLVLPSFSSLSEAIEQGQEWAADRQVRRQAWERGAAWQAGLRPMMDACAQDLA